MEMLHRHFWSAQDLLEWNQGLSSIIQILVFKGETDLEEGGLNS
jgi:hypothetical protein